MITVAIIGVLAVLASVGYARWIRTAKTAESTSMIAAIKGAQDVYRTDAMRYLAVSTSLEDKHPAGEPSSQKTPWAPSTCTGVCANFRILSVHADSSVYYRYSSTAGNAGTTPTTAGARTFTASVDPWFVVQAKGDLDGNGVYSFYYSASSESLVWSVNPDE
jgi:type IV pilus assembly protein PilA